MANDPDVSPAGSPENFDRLRDLPQPAPQPDPLPSAQDVSLPGRLMIAVDATDIERGIFRARMKIPVLSPGRMTLLYPKWMPGYHSPQNPLALFAGLVIEAGGAVLDWRRDPVEVYAFHIDVPAGVTELDVSFQFLSPTTANQGDVVATHDMINLQWGRMILYPAGHFSRRIVIAARLTLPKGWAYDTALMCSQDRDGVIAFDPVTLDTLVDTPVLAARAKRSEALSPDGTVQLSLFGRTTNDLAISADQIDLHRSLVAEAEALFGSRHFDRYRFLVALSDELGGGGIEHHRSAEIVLTPDHFRAWDEHLTRRDVFAHEFTHSWNGKFRRGADSWNPTFQEPIRNSLMWMYEGQTQYWGHVLTARSGLWTTAHALESLAKIAATYDVRPGGLWRTMADTTRDPVIASRAPLPWPSWQRSEDYYSQGQLMWLAADTLIREISADTRSLDDFARAFFGVEPGRMTTLTYEFDDVVQSLKRVAPYDWSGFLLGELESREPGAPLEGLERGGYRLIYEPYRSEFCRSFDALNGQYDLRFSLGLNIGKDGSILEVMWGSPAFDAGLTTGSLIQTVGDEPYSEFLMSEAVDHSRKTGCVRLTVATRAFHRDVELAYDEGHRFPHLLRLEASRARLDEILAPATA